MNLEVRLVLEDVEDKNSALVDLKEALRLCGLQYWIVEKREIKNTA